MRFFPRLKACNFRITSHQSASYNCIAWAAGVNDDWWEYRRGYTWPYATRAETIDAAVEVFVAQGYEKCDNDTLESGCQKIAINGDEYGYTHAAKQLESGHWSSKLGKLQDIEHKNLSALTEGDYGEAKQILRKKIAVQE
jgi:hypothetical protein